MVALHHLRKGALFAMLLSCLLVGASHASNKAKVKKHHSSHLAKKSKKVKALNGKAVKKQLTRQNIGALTVLENLAVQGHTIVGHHRITGGGISYNNQEQVLAIAFQNHKRECWQSCSAAVVKFYIIGSLEHDFDCWEECCVRSIDGFKDMDADKMDKLKAEMAWLEDAKRGHGHHHAKCDLPIVCSGELVLLPVKTHEREESKICCFGDALHCSTQLCEPVCLPRPEVQFNEHDGAIYVKLTSKKIHFKNACVYYEIIGKNLDVKRTKVLKYHSRDCYQPVLPLYPCIG